MDEIRKEVAKAKDSYKISKSKHDRQETDPNKKWMFSSVDSRIKSKSDSAKKKSKKKHKSRHKKSSSEDNSSESEKDTWIEKPSTSTTMEIPKVERDSWMLLPSHDPIASRVEKKLIDKRDKKEIKPTLSAVDQPGQHKRELNPYWKDGGTGLPKASRSDACPLAFKSVGDAGVSWLRKAYQRAVEESERTQTPLEDIIKERYGSMDKFQEILNDAEIKSGGSSHRDRGHYNRPDRYTDHSRTSYGKYDKSSKMPMRKPKFDDDDDGGVGVGYDSWSTPSSSHDKKLEIAKSYKWRKEECKRVEVEVKKKAEIKDNVKISSESESSDSEPEVKPREESPPKILSDKEMNALSAKILKAQMLGNKTLETELQNALLKAQKARENNSANKSSQEGQSSNRNVVVLTKTDYKGLTRPLKEPEDDGYSGSKRKEKAGTHDKSGKRVRYFADDDKYSLKELFEHEKLNTAEDHNAMFSRLARKGMETTNDEYDMDDVLTERASSKVSSARLEHLERQQAIKEHKRSSKAMDSCHYCLENKTFPKHLIVALGMKVYLCLPEFKSLTEGHCLIVPMAHSLACTYLDEEVWAEIKIFQKGLTKMFEDMNLDAVFFETSMHFKYYPHVVVQCVPMPKETGEMASIYFKKAILECESEWAQNKKLVELNQRDVRRAIPKGLPYFAVTFGLDGGFAHVIEDERLFPKTFAQSVLGGMLDLEPYLWRKPFRENFEDQSKKVMQFVKWWEPFDWTQRLKQEDT